MRLLPVISGALAALTLFSPIGSYLRREVKIDEKPAEKQETEENTALTEALAEYLPGIVCWGDSLTAGAGGYGVTYPDVLDALIEEKITAGAPIDVVNMGVGGETSQTIVARSGTIPFLVQEFTIPADCTPTKITLFSDLHKRVLPMIQGGGGVNPVSIGGVEGDITVKLSTVVEWSEYFFTRFEPGEEVHIEKGTEVVTYSADKWRDYINVVFIGTNGSFSNAEDLISQQRAILDRSEKNGDRFIIIGLYTLNGAQVKKKYDGEYMDALDAAMTEEYGRSYINLREYLMNGALTDAGIEPTEEDCARIADGLVPTSLLDPDLLHLNPTGYKLLGKLIFERMDELEYFDEVKAALVK